MKLRKLKDVLLTEDLTQIDEDKNEEAFAELIQFLDETSLGLVIREARDDGRRALEILREHYAGSGKPRIIALYTKLTSLRKENNETVTDYVIRAETSANALKNTGEVVSDGLLIAMTMKGLPKEFKPFVVVTTQTEKVMTFQKFKAALRNYEENEKATEEPMEEMSNAVMKMNFKDNNGQSGNTNKNNSVKCFACGEIGHRSFQCDSRRDRK